MLGLAGRGKVFCFFFGTFLAFHISDLFPAIIITILVIGMIPKLIHPFLHLLKRLIGHYLVNYGSSDYLSIIDWCSCIIPLLACRIPYSKFDKFIIMIGEPEIFFQICIYWWWSTIINKFIMSIFQNHGSFTYSTYITQRK